MQNLCRRGYIEIEPRNKRLGEGCPGCRLWGYAQARIMIIEKEVEANGLGRVSWQVDCGVCLQARLE